MAEKLAEEFKDYDPCKQCLCDSCEFWTGFNGEVKEYLKLDKKYGGEFLVGKRNKKAVKIILDWLKKLFVKKSELPDYTLNMNI